MFVSKGLKPSSSAGMPNSANLASYTRMRSLCALETLAMSYCNALIIRFLLFRTSSSLLLTYAVKEQTLLALSIRPKGLDPDSNISGGTRDTCGVCGRQLSKMTLYCLGLSGPNLVFTMSAMSIPAERSTTMPLTYMMDSAVNLGIDLHDVLVHL